MSNYTVVDQELLYGARAGIYYGPKSRVLMRRGERWLLWTPGHAVWSGTGQPWSYASACMMVSDPHLHGGYCRIGSGGRLKTMLIERASQIDEYFGEGASKLVDPKRTVVL